MVAGRGGLDPARVGLARSARVDLVLRADGDRTPDIRDEPLVRDGHVQVEALCGVDADPVERDFHHRATDVGGDGAGLDFRVDLALGRAAQVPFDLVRGLGEEGEPTATIEARDEERLVPTDHSFERGPGELRRVEQEGEPADTGRVDRDRVGDAATDEHGVASFPEGFEV